MLVPTPSNKSGRTLTVYPCSGAGAVSETFSEFFDVVCPFPATGWPLRSGAASSSEALRFLELGAIFEKLRDSESQSAAGWRVKSAGKAELSSLPAKRPKGAHRKLEMLEEVGLVSKRCEQDLQKSVNRGGTDLMLAIARAKLISIRS